MGLSGPAENREAGNRKRLRDESQDEKARQRAGDTHTVTNPQAFQVENVTPLGAQTPIP